MRYLFITVAFFYSIICFSQEQITDIHSTRYISSFYCALGTECIMNGNIDGEPFTVYVGFYQVFVDFENEAISDYNIPYTYGCFIENLLLDDKYLYLVSHSTLVIDIEAGRMHDHFSFGDGLSFRSAEISGDDVVISMSNDNENLLFGRYNPETKQKTLSDPYKQLISYDGGYYFVSSLLGLDLVGEFVSDDWAKQSITSGLEFTYLGDGLFKNEDGRLIEGLLDSNPIESCIPQTLSGVELSANKIYDRPNFRIIETYDSIEDDYTYYYGDNCSFRMFTTSDYNSVHFDFFNYNYFGFSSSGEYVRMKFVNGSPYFVPVSTVDYRSSDKWLMSEDTAYLITRRTVNDELVHQILKYEPSGFSNLDIETMFKEFPLEEKINHAIINEDGNIELTFNNSEEGVHVITFSSNGNQISDESLFYSWYHDYDEKSVRWSAYDGGLIRKNQIDTTDNYRIDRVEGTQVTTDTLLAQPYIDKEVEVYIFERDGDQIIRFYTIASGTETEVINPDVPLSFHDEIVRIGDEIWFVNNDNSEEDDVFKFGMNGDNKGTINLNVRSVIESNEAFYIQVLNRLVIM